MTGNHADRIAEQLEELIVTGAFPDGERLNEVELAERFGVSRTPIREAFQKLTASKLIEHIPRRGVFIRQPGAVEMVEMFEVMAEMEAVCGRLAARRISKQAIERLHEINAACQQALDADDADGYYRENELFHYVIYDQAGNSFLSGETKALHRRLKPFRRMQLHLRGRMRQSMSEHNRIVEALAQGDQDAVAEVMRAHVAVQGERFNDLMAYLKTQHGLAH